MVSITVESNKNKSEIVRWRAVIGVSDRMQAAKYLQRNRIYFLL